MMNRLVSYYCFAWSKISNFRKIARMRILSEVNNIKVNRSLEEDGILELLVTLIEKLENENYPLDEGTPHSMLLHLMESNEIKQENLVGVIGSRGVVLEVVNGNHSISKAQAKASAEFFAVDVGLFI